MRLRRVDSDWGRTGQALSQTGTLIDMIGSYQSCGICVGFGYRGATLQPEPQNMDFSARRKSLAAIWESEEAWQIWYPRYSFMFLPRQLQFLMD
jgi:hypothetical protein